MVIKFAYAKGAKFERKIRDFFRAKGFYVSRSAKSSFPDLIAISPEGKPLFIECKCSEKLPFNPTKLMCKEDYARAIGLINSNNTPFYLFFKNKKIKRRFDAIAIGGYGTIELEAILGK